MPPKGTTKVIPVKPSGTKELVNCKKTAITNQMLIPGAQAMTAITNQTLIPCYLESLSYFLLSVTWGFLNTKRYNLLECWVKWGGSKKIPLVDVSYSWATKFAYNILSYRAFHFQSVCHVDTISRPCVRNMPNYVPSPHRMVL